MNEKFGFNANVKVELFGSNGELKEERVVHNAVTDTGVYLILEQSLAAPTGVKIGWMALGSGTALSMYEGVSALIAGSINALTSKTRTNKVITMVGDWAAGDATGTISEAGTTTSATNEDSCIMYATFTPIVKGAADTLKITWTLTGAN